MTIKPKYVQEDINGNKLTDKEKEWTEQNSLDLDPFDKRNWKTAESRDEWRDVLRKASSAKSTAEWKSVSEGKTDRKAAIIHVNNKNRERWLRRLSENNLVYRDIRFTKPYGGFSHKFFPTDKSDPERITYAVIAKNEDIADKMEEAETELSGIEKHETVGKLLGFPRCCRKFFNKHFLEKGIIDPMYEATCNTSDVNKIEGSREKLHVPSPNPYNNALWRYYGWSFVTHLPCSWDCEKTAEIGKMREQIMRDNGYSQAADKLYEWLNAPAVWTGKAGLLNIKNKHFTGSARTSDYWSMKTIVWRAENKPGGSIL